MRRLVLALPLLLAAAVAQAGEAEVKAAQDTIDSQIRAFRAGENDTAYSFAAPGIRSFYPTVDGFMDMVSRGYAPVHRPRSYAFGKSREEGGTVVQQVLVVGPDGKDYEAVYTLELQPDGVFRITGVSIRASKALST